MSADTGLTATELRADGAAATNNLLMQTQADLLGIPVIRPAITETTALGAAYLAGLAIGFWGSVDEISGQWRTERRFEPQMSPGNAKALRDGWSAAVSRSKSWVPGR
jgi:glycerol kinase